MRGLTKHRWRTLWYILLHPISSYNLLTEATEAKFTAELQFVFKKYYGDRITELFKRSRMTCEIFKQTKQPPTQDKGYYYKLKQ